MDYEWDPQKAKSNFRKHGVRFADAVGVFQDPYAITMLDDNSDEERYVTIGIDALLQIIVVSYTWRDYTIRIISARKATRAERRKYLEGI